MTVAFGLVVAGAALAFGATVAAGTARIDGAVGAGLFAPFSFWRDS